MSSVLGRMTVPGMGIYAASKHAVEAISESLRAELAPFGIDVVVVAPGFVRTEISSTPGADPAAAGGAYAELTSGTAGFVAQEVARGADPAALADLVVRLATEGEPPARTEFPIGEEAAAAAA